MTGPMTAAHPALLPFPSASLPSGTPGFKAIGVIERPIATPTIRKLRPVAPGGRLPPSRSSTWAASSRKAAQPTYLATAEAGADTGRARLLE